MFFPARRHIFAHQFIQFPVVVLPIGEEHSAQAGLLPRPTRIAGREWAIPSPSPPSALPCSASELGLMVDRSAPDSPSQPTGASERAPQQSALYLKPGRKTNIDAFKREQQASKQDYDRHRTFDRTRSPLLPLPWSSHSSGSFSYHLLHFARCGSGSAAEVHRRLA